MDARLEARIRQLETLRFCAGDGRESDSAAAGTPALASLASLPPLPSTPVLSPAPFFPLQFASAPRATPAIVPGPTPRIAGTGTAEPDGPAHFPFLGPVSDTFECLLGAIQTYAGIRPDESVRNKVKTYLDALSEDARRTLMARIGAGQLSEPEWAALVETVLIHETFFFRDPAQFEFLRSAVLDQMIRHKRRDARPKITLWSAACSTGEEAFSLALVVLDALLAAGEATEVSDGEICPNSRWTISVLGTDISPESLSRARAGIYRNENLGSFRGLPIRYQRFFQHHYEIHPDVHGNRAGTFGPPAAGDSRRLLVREGIRKFVSFQPFNLLRETPPAGGPAEGFDIIFCRNVMIYFEYPTRERVQAMLHRALRPGGYLALGPTDTLVDRALFRPHWDGSAVLYQKHDADGGTRVQR